MINNWETALIAFAQREHGKAFEWGVTNCVALGFRAIDVMCGTEFGETYYDKMSSERAVKRFLLRNNAATVARDLVAIGGLSFVGNNPNFAQVGDIILADHDGTICCHVCIGANMLTSHQDFGVIILPMRAAQWPELVHVVRGF